MLDKVGGTFTSRTMTRKVLVTLRGGVPLSVAAMENVLVDGLLVCCGVQVSTPVVGVKTAPLTPATRL